MNAIVVYSSKTGFAERYARWIADELSIEAHPADRVDIEDLKGYDTIIYGGGLYVVGINGIKMIKDILNKLQGKNIVVFATGASPPRKEVVNEIRDKNFSEQEQEMMEFFYLRGGFDYDRLGVKDKLLMKMLKKKLEMKKELTEDEKGMLEAYDRPVDFTKRENIDELIEHVKKISHV
ncbi:MAG: flavodoxin domain-containing protein [Thermoplasmatota archaeon]